VQPDLITAACPFCVVMLSDGVTLRQRQGQAPAGVEVSDVADVLLRSVRSGQPAEADRAPTHSGKA
jgi:Fe-S oxidoreductase